MLSLAGLLSSFPRSFGVVQKSLVTGALIVQGLDECVRSWLSTYFCIAAGLDRKKGKQCRTVGFHSTVQASVIPEMHSRPRMVWRHPFENHYYKDVSFIAEQRRIYRYSSI